MQELIEDVVRALGFGVLKSVTLGRYRGGSPADRLSEGAIGFAVVLAAIYVLVAW